MKTRFSHAMLAFAAAIILAQATATVLPGDVLFQEDFEYPDVPGYSQGITPDIWIRASQGFGSGDHGMTDKSGGDFSAPVGNEQAYAFRYSNSGITTKENALGSPLAPGGGYEVSFDVVKDNATGVTGYNVKLIAFGTGAARNDCRSIPSGSTQLAAATGNAPSNGSIATVTFTFIPNATTHAAEFGKDLGIRVGGLIGCIVDNIRFRAIPGTGSGLNLVTTNPLDDSVNNLASSPVKAIFSQNIAAGSGNITLKNLTDLTDTVIPVGDPRIAINGCCLDILPGPHLEWGNDYAVLIGSGAVVKSPGGTSFTGISDPTVWNFTMMGGDPLLYSISQLTSHILGDITLSAAELDTIKKNLDTVTGRFAESSDSITALLDLVSTYDTGTIAGRKGPLWVSTSLPKRNAVTNDLHWTMFNVMQNIMDRIYTGTTLAAHESLLSGFKFASSANFPGNCATPSPTNVHTATISASYLDTYGPSVLGDGPGTYARKPTGCYLAPGTVATVTVPASLVNTGYKIRVGCHSWDFSAKPDIKRLDRVTRVYDIKATQTKVANPLGGGIYIEVPFLANAGVVDVDVTGAARSPYFSVKSFHATTSTQWETVERSNPGPWADFQTDKFMMQVPKSWIYSMTGAQATQLMTDWDAAMDAINDLMGYTAFNPATGPDKYIFGKETMYPQVDLLLKNSVYAPGYPSVNNTYNPTGNYNNGYANSHLVRGPQNAPDYEFHEQGHGYKFPKFAGESESTVNLLHVAVWNGKLGKSMDEAFRKSRGYTRTYMTLDTTAIAWMCVFNFSPREVPMADAEKAYQLKGHAKFVDIANLYGWDVLGRFWGSMVDMDDKGISYATDTDSMLLRLCQAVGKDIRPLFHFWGIHPQNPSSLAAAIAAENIPADLAIKERLLHYKSLLPADNAAFRTFATGWWGTQPSINGNWEEREHSRQWDQTALFGPGDQQRADITINEEYIPACAQQIRDRVDELVDLYFPASIGPNPMTFELAPSPMNTTTIGMVATEAISLNGPVEYYFENTSNGNLRDWSTDRRWENTGLSNGVTYTYRVKARDNNGLVTDWSATADATVGNDVTAPSPDPMSFSTPPTALGENSITMTASLASDISGVEYFFTCTGGVGGHDSGWQDEPTYTDIGLTHSTEFTYTVMARDKSSGQWATAPSPGASATTSSPDLDPPTVNTYSPVVAAVDVAIETDLVLTFSEDIAIGTGNITIHNITDNTKTMIDVTDAGQVSVSGSVLTINPNANLTQGRDYAVRIDATAIDDLAGNSFAGIADDVTWFFSVPALPGPGTLILDPFSLPGDFGTTTATVGAGTTYSGGWVNYSGGRNIALKSSTATGRPVGATDVYIGNIDHRKGQRLDLGYTTVGTGEQYDISFYTRADATSFDNGEDFGELTLFYTANNVIGGTVVDSIILQGFTSAGVWTQTSVSAASFSIDPGAGKKLFLKFFKKTTGTGDGDVNDENIGLDHVSVARTGGGPSNTFADWIAGYPAVGGLTGFNDDFDLDGIGNALENYFGTDPAVFSAGLVSGDLTGNTFTFTHPLGDTPADDIAATYRWSTDLVTFHDDGATDGGVTVDFSQGAPSGGMVTVTATITGTVPDRLFVSIKATQN